ncbi:hypothetical protein FUAX_49300 (plasmid) [Fulvitalea axinellae]|uniref:DUF2007 domain-containing protein n=1 Tax=Fulvitalea axinellae TaxID=1182444 RepID=A0AAU9CX15_9BACT|nr:hypothetical protein FUAX_49300 [Fulvitalea axinellae]
MTKETIDNTFLQEQKDYSIFRKFNDPGLANETAILLINSGIPAVLGNNSPSLDNTVTGGGANEETEVRIPKTYFEKAEAILKQQAEELVEDIDKDHYLYSFTDEELFDILLKPEEWGELDRTLAPKILDERGKPVDEALVKQLRNQRIKDLAKPDESHLLWVGAGYAFALLGGFLGIIIGYSLWKSRKTLPNGEKVSSYSVKDQMHGKYIFILGIILLPLYLAIRFL